MLTVSSRSSAFVDYAKASGRSKELDVLLTEVGDMVEAQNAYLLSQTILETRLYI